MNSAVSIEKAFKSITNGDIESSKRIIREEYPFIPFQPDKRSYTMTEKMKIIIRDIIFEHFGSPSMGGNGHKGRTPLR